MRRACFVGHFGNLRKNAHHVRTNSVRAVVGGGSIMRYFVGRVFKAFDGELLFTVAWRDKYNFVSLEEMQFMGHERKQMVVIRRR